MAGAPETRQEALLLPEVCLRLVVSFGGACVLLAWGRVSGWSAKLTREAMRGSVVLPPSFETIVIWNAATGARERVEVSLEAPVLFFGKRMALGSRSMSRAGGDEPRGRHCPGLENDG